MIAAKKTQPFALVDVFADAPLRGNPLAVVPEADCLDDRTMRAVAAEFNLSETTFILSPTVAGGDFRLRSFTPTGDEVFGAGHNSLGAWWWLANAGALVGGDSFHQQLGDAVLPVTIERMDEGIVVGLRQDTPRFVGRLDDAAPLADALGLHTDDLVADPKGVPVVSTGASHMLVELSSREAVDRAEPDSVALLERLRIAGAQGCYIYAAAAGLDDKPYSRFFNPTVGIREDPATGSAAGPLGWLLGYRGITKWDDWTTIIQGAKMGRESRLTIRAQPDEVTLLGTAVLTATGDLRLSV